MGTVEGDDCKVAVWILIDGLGWWPKPFSNSFVLPDANGNWECDITTGGVDEYSDNTFIQKWNYTGPYIPKGGQENIRMNLWLNNQPPSDGKEIEVIIEKFEFKPSFVEIIAPSSIFIAGF